VACHNSEDGVTISGPPDSIAKFVNQLKSEGVFAREVNSSGIAFHSWYIAAAGPLFKEKVAGVRLFIVLITKKKKLFNAISNIF
jgi:fatty acid synthase, animal type